MAAGEDFGYVRNKEENPLLNIIKKATLLGAVLFSISCFIYITVNAYYFAYSDKDSNIKVIKSPPEPIKVIEEEGDGVAIKDIDKTIYDNIVGNKNLSSEKLNQVKIIKQAQTPLAQTPLANAVSVKKDPDETVVNDPSSKLAANQVNNQSGRESKIMVYDTGKVVEKVGAQGGEKVNDASLIAPKKPQPQNQAETKNIKGLSRVQLVALSSKSAAIAYWERLKKSYPALLSGLNYFVSEVNLGQKGTFYRLQIGNFRSQIEAEDFCQKFIFQTGKSKADCIIVE